MKHEKRAYRPLSQLITVRNVSRKPNHSLTITKVQAHLLRNHASNLLIKLWCANNNQLNPIVGAARWEADGFFL